MAPTTGAVPKRRRYGDQKSMASIPNDECFGVQSLPVAIIPEDFSGDPTDGEEYLAVVRREAAAAPDVFFAAHNPYAEALLEGSSSAPQKTAPPASEPSTWTTKEDELVMPSTEWRAAFETQFKNAREALSNPPIEPVKLTKDDLPKITNTNAWYAWIHGRPPPASSAEELEKQSSKGYEWRTREPSGLLLLRLSTEQMLGLLEAFPYWIAQRVGIPDSQNKAGVRRDGEVLQALHARWIFALLLKLDGRLVSEEISTLRTLSRACVAAITLSRIRRKALRSRSKEDAGEGGAGEGEKERMRRDEAGAWMVVAIVAGVWGQLDLWDDAAADMKRVT